MTRTIADYVKDINDMITKIEEFSEDIKFEQFEKDEKTKYAVVRALEIMGEASKNIPPFIKKKYNKVPWKKMAGMRDKLIHEYFGVNTKVLWQTINEEIPVIKRLLKNISEEIHDELRLDFRNNENHNK